MLKNLSSTAGVLIFAFFSVLASAFGVPPLEKAADIRGRVWFNAAGTPRMSLKALAGDVVLVFFWTANDLSCQKAFPLLNRWYAKYRDQGFQIIGVHDSEWGFNISEGEVSNKIKALEAEFPVVLDEDSSVWINFKKAGWPSYFLIDRKGYVRARYFGTLDARNVETMIRILVEEGESRLLKEKGGQML